MIVLYFCPSNVVTRQKMYRNNACPKMGVFASLPWQVLVKEESFDNEASGKIFRQEIYRGMATLGQ